MPIDPRMFFEDMVERIAKLLPDEAAATFKQEREATTTVFFTSFGDFGPEPIDLVRQPDGSWK